MSLAIQIALFMAAAVVASLVVVSILFFYHPIAMTFWLRRSALRRRKFRKIHIRTSVGEQTVWKGGSGRVVVLLHGAGDQAGTWFKVAPELQHEFQLVIPDLAGHGKSQPASGLLSLGTLLTALEQVLDAMVPNNVPIVLAGNSLGAWMSMLYAQKHSERVQRVILIDGGPIRHVSEIGIMPKDREEARRAFDAVLDPSTRKPPNYLLDDLVRLSNTGPISRLLDAGEEDLSRYLLDGELSNFRAPVDIIWGASDRLVPLDYAKTLQSRLPRCTLTVIERCGHTPQLERPRELTRLLLKILASEPSPAAAQPVASTRVGPTSS